MRIPRIKGKKADFHSRWSLSWMSGLIALAGCSGCQLPERASLGNGASPPTESALQEMDSHPSSPSHLSQSLAVDSGSDVMARNVENRTPAPVAASITAASRTATTNDEVRLQVTGIVPNAGPVRIAVFSASDRFPDHQTAAKKIVVESRSEVAQEALTELPAGPVAIAAYQDLNNDGILNRSSFGIPSEPYGFSNDARGQMGPPKFADAAVEPARGNTNPIVVSLQKLSY